MRNDGRWVRTTYPDGERYTVAFGALLSFTVARRRSREARMLWTVCMNGEELDWCCTFDEAAVRVHEEARAALAPALQDWQRFVNRTHRRLDRTDEAR